MQASRLNVEGAHIDDLYKGQTYGIKLHLERHQLQHLLRHQQLQQQQQQPHQHQHQQQQQQQQQ